MAKKRNCRRNDEERSIHEQAVALRKMTDRQLVDLIEKLKNTSSSQTPDYLKDKLLTELSTMRGVGNSTMSKITKVLDAL